MLDVYHRDIIECIRVLYGDPEFSPHLIFKPERHYVDEDRTIRMYSDMHTGKWWWDTQVAYFTFLIDFLSFLILVSDYSGCCETGGHDCPCHHILRQNPVDTVP